jgi:hypothetical protein
VPSPAGPASCLRWGLSVWRTVASIAGVRTGRANLTAPRRRAVHALALELTTAFAILEAAFLRSDLT